LRWCQPAIQATPRGRSLPRSRDRRHGAPAGRGASGWSVEPGAKAGPSAGGRRYRRSRAERRATEGRSQAPRAPVRVDLPLAKWAPTARFRASKAEEKPRKSAASGPSAPVGGEYCIFARPIMTLARLFHPEFRPRPNDCPPPGRDSCRVLATGRQCLRPHREFALPRARGVWHNDPNFSTSLRRFRWQAQNRAVSLPILSVRGEGS